MTMLVTSPFRMTSSTPILEGTRLFGAADGEAVGDEFCCLDRPGFTDSRGLRLPSVWSVFDCQT